MNIICSANTPIGIISALYENGAIRRVYFPSEPLPENVPHDDSLGFSLQIKEYFEGKRKQFDLPLFISGTVFRQNIYKAVLMIPYGDTSSYADVAFAAGYPRAMRAAGSALKVTTLPLLVPCHRVVHKNYKTSAYRGGLDLKQYLLDLEQRYK